jgi:NADH:ubiquinone oxidoreductase subunit 2 (subunit N)
VLYFIVLELLGVIPIVFIVLGQRRPSLFSYEVAIKYLLFNIFTAFLFLISVIIMYSLTLSLDLSYISRCIVAAQSTGDITAQRLFAGSFILFLTPFFFKLGLAPFH